MLTLGSLFDGIGGWQLAAIRNGVKPVWSAEIDRLTELECERCQGLPDYWTLIDHKSCTSTARYKAIGNGMAQPCADFVIRGLVRETIKRNKS